MQPNLTSKPEVVQGPTLPFMYVEKVGEFEKVARLAWDELHGTIMPVLEHEKFSAMMGLSKMDPKTSAPGGTYQAGVVYKSEPSKVPSGIKLRKLDGGRYAKFMLKGPYEQLGPSYPIAMQRVTEAGLKIRGDAFFMESYVNNPMTTAKEDLLTEIYIPVQ